MDAIWLLPIAVGFGYLGVICLWWLIEERRWAKLMKEVKQMGCAESTKAGRHDVCATAEGGAQTPAPPKAKQEGS